MVNSVVATGVLTPALHVSSVRRQPQHACMHCRTQFTANHCRVFSLVWDAPAKYLPIQRNKEKKKTDGLFDAYSIGFLLQWEHDWSSLKMVSLVRR